MDSVLGIQNWVAGLGWLVHQENHKKKRGLKAPGSSPGFCLGTGLLAGRINLLTGLSFADDERRSFPSTIGASLYPHGIASTSLMRS